MSLATDDREGLPPRLRHTEAPARSPHQHSAPPPDAGNADVAAPHPHDQRLQLQLPLLPHAARPRDAAHAAQAGGVRADLPRCAARGWCEGLFVTTGIPGARSRSMDDLITALELLRERHRFGGYIHVKLVPGAEPAQIERLTAGEPSVGQPRGAVRRESRVHRPGEELRRRSPISRACAGSSCWSAPSGPWQAGRPAAPRRRSGMTMQFVVGATQRYRPHHPRHGGRLYAGGRDPPRALQRLSPDPRHADGGRAGHAGAPRAPALSGGLSAAALRIRRGRGRLRGDGQPPARGWIPRAPGPRPPRALPGGSGHRILRELLRVPGIGPTAARRIVAEQRNDFRSLAHLEARCGTTRAGGFLTLRGRRVQTRGGSSSSGSGPPKKTWAYPTWSIR